MFRSDHTSRGAKARLYAVQRQKVPPCGGSSAYPARERYTTEETDHAIFDYSGRERSAVLLDRARPLGTA